MNTDGRTVVFLGPSLELHEAAEHLQARYLAPIRRGDLPRGNCRWRSIRRHRGRRIRTVVGSIGDGGWLGTQARRSYLGRRFNGCTPRSGMSLDGNDRVGWIFQKYVEESLRADDEVALLFDPVSRRATTIPLVNVRWSLQMATEEELIQKESAAMLVELARSVRFTDRTFESLLQASANSTFKEEMKTLVEFMKQDPLRTDRKRLDALLLLETMQASIPASNPTRLNHN